MLELDGSFGEGGGQILRSCLSLALLTQQAFHLRNIRAGRPKPGLHAQHLMSVRAAATVGRAQCVGAALQSTDLVFEPNAVQAGNYPFAIGTAGATGLVLQTVYLPLALRGGSASRLIIEGGTHNDHSPCFHFLANTWRAYLERLGLDLDMTLVRPGFYPRGGGRVEIDIEPCVRLRGLRLLDADPITEVTGFSAVAGLPIDIASRQACRASTRLKAAGIKAILTEGSLPGGPGTVLTLATRASAVGAPSTLFFGLGARGKRAERVADEAVDQLIAYRDAGAPVDGHSADQLLLPLAFAAGPSEFRVAEVTRHLMTNIEVIRRFVDRAIVCEGVEGAAGAVRVE